MREQTAPWTWRSLLLMALFSLVLIGCSSVKKVGDNQYLLTKNTIYLEGEKIRSDQENNLLLQQPNRKLAGIPLRLHLYNLAKENPDSLYRDWLERKPKRKERLTKLLSEKQVNRLGESFLVSGYSNFLKRVGEAPTIIDSGRTKKSRDRLSAFYRNQGYFNNAVRFDVVPSNRKKRAQLDYHIRLGQPFFVDSIRYNVTAPELDSLLRRNLDQTAVQKGQFNLGNFNAERERLTRLFRNTGVYNFQESSINFDVAGDTTAVAQDSLLTITLNVRNPSQRNNDSLPSENYRIHRFKKVNIYTDYRFDTNKDSLQSEDYEGYTLYYQDKLRYKPKALIDAIFFEKDSIYRDLDRIRTNRQITNLNNFTYPNMEFQADSSGYLTSNIYLTPRPKYSLNVAFDVLQSNIQQIGTTFSASVVSRNIFGGAENLSFSARGSVGILSDSPGSITSELGGTVNLTFPRIWFPINTEKVIPYYMVPQTRLTMGTNFQQNIGLDRQSFNTTLSYNWTSSAFVRNAVDLLNIEFVRNVNPDNFFNQYRNTFSTLNTIATDDGLSLTQEQSARFFEVTQPGDPLSLSIPNGAAAFTSDVLAGQIPAISTENTEIVRSIEERRQRLIENNLIFTANYTWVRNTRASNADEDFSQWRIKLEAAGNLLSAVSNFIDFRTNENDKKLVFGVPFTQYFKTEVDYIKHWDFPGNSVLAMRGFMGMAIPYGNSDNVPFVRSYFAGGANDNRGWNAYELGPGRTNNLNDFNEANFKLSLNLEYRFPIVGNLNGALFADAGNIWNFLDNESNPDATFNGIQSLGDIALGTGLGLRFDFSYFVFRFDAGFKTYNPALPYSDRWLTDFKLNKAVFNIGINYPF